MSGRRDGIPLVGRRQELAALLRCLDDAATGQGRVALLAGEAGIGKTRLLAELAGRARTAGWQVLAGGAYDLEGMPPYAPFREALRDYLRTAPSDELRAHLAAVGPEVVLLAPELRRRLPDLPAPAAIGDEQRYALFESACALLLGIARQAEARGLVLILDDLHWADTPSLLLLQHLGRHLSSAPLLVAGAYRSAEVDRLHPLTALLATLQREGVLELLPLGALSVEECAALIERVSGRPVAAAVAEALYRATEGHPLFLGELVGHLQAEGHDLSDAAAALTDWPVPVGLRAVIDVRLARLSGPANQLLQAAAVLGDGVRFDVLSDVCGVEPQLLLDALDEALAAGLLREEGEGYGVSHALIRQALLEGLSLPRRQRLHQLAAQAIETLYARDLTPHLGALALHYRLAGPAAIEPALAYTRRAGEAALAVYAWEDAASQWQAALDLIGPADTAERCALLLALGEAQQRAGDAADRPTFLQAAELARSLGDGTLLARAALGYAGIIAPLWRSDAAVVALLEEALAALGDADSALRCRLLGRLAIELISTDEAPRWEAISSEAVAAARRLGDASVLADVLNARHHVLTDPERLEERLALAAEIVAVAGAAGDKHLQARGRSWTITNLMELGDLAAVDGEVAAFCALAGELRLPSLLWRAGVLQAMRALLAGRFDDAERLSAEALQMGLQTESLTARTMFAAQRQTLSHQRGTQNERDLLVARVTVAQNARSPIPRWWLAQVALNLGHREEAQEQLERLAQHDFADLPRDGSQLIGLAILAEISVGLGDRPRAAALYPQLAPFATRLVVASAAILCLGSAAYYLGLLATLLERWQQAEEHFTLAEATHERLEARAFQVLTWLAHGRMLLAREQAEDGGSRPDPAQTERALTLLGQARALAEELGMGRVVAEAVALARPAVSPVAARFIAPDDAHAELPDGLTPREAEVLRLIAAGRTGKQIADELILAVDTVRRHTTNIYAKIGAHGRADATAYALRHGLIPARPE